MAVVDAQLRVHGICGPADRRRIDHADADIGNTNAPSIMIGEKAADMLLNTAP